MNVLIVYETKQGQTEKIARRLAELLTVFGHVVQVTKASLYTKGQTLEAFQLVVVGAPIHAGGYPEPVQKFVREHLAQLRAIPSVFLSVGLAIASRTSNGEAQTQEVVDKLLAKTSWRPRHVELIAGALPYSKYNVFIRYIMKRITAKEGGDTDTSRDYEYTDWSALERFAQRLNDIVSQDAAPSVEAAQAAPKVA